MLWKETLIPNVTQRVLNIRARQQACRCDRNRRRDLRTDPFSDLHAPANFEDDASYDECTDDLNRVCADLANAAEDTGIALATISDNNIFFETKREYAKEMVTGISSVR